MAACYLPFTNRNMEVLVFVFRPTVVVLDELVDSLERFSRHAETLGCVHAALLKSIHGSMIIWLGTWMKRSNKNKELLREALLSILRQALTMAILMEENYFDPYGGEARDKSPAAKFTAGNVVSISTASFVDLHGADDQTFQYKCLDLLRSRFQKMAGATAGVSMRSHGKDRIVNFYAWKQIRDCYSWILSPEFNTIKPYFGEQSVDLKYDIFKVFHISGESVAKLQFCPRRHMLLEGSEAGLGAQGVRNYSKQRLPHR